jgi:hypothetical protein
VQSVLLVRPSVFDRNILALDIAGFTQALADRGAKVTQGCRRPTMEKADDRQRRLLRARGERPRRRRTAERG